MAFDKEILPKNFVEHQKIAFSFTISTQPLAETQIGINNTLYSYQVQSAYISTTENPAEPYNPLL